jgi:deoxyribonuclease-4
MWSAPVGDGANLTLTTDLEWWLMLIGAHVPTSGGLLKVLERAEDTRSDAIQIFNQSPRMWRPTNYTEEDFAAFREGMESSRLKSAMVHMIYLINPATADKQMRKKSLDSLTHALRVGEGIGAIGLVVHPGALKDDTRANAKTRAIQLLKEALAETDSCPILYENTAGSPQLLGRDFDETAELIEQTGGPKRLGLCIDSCHLHATGYDVRTPEGVAEIADEIEAKIGLDQLKAIHLNDSRDSRGSNRDRHAAIGKGEIGRKGFRTFLSEPRFQDLPAVSETPGLAGKGPDRKEVLLMRQLRREGLKARNLGAKAG